MWKHNGKEYGNTMEIGINFLNTFFNMIAEIRNLISACCAEINQLTS